MKYFLFIVLLFFVSCGKETKEAYTITKLLSKVENYRLSSKGKTEVTYFAYDFLQRVVGVATYVLDSTKEKLDSTLMDSLTFKYIDKNKFPDYSDAYHLLPSGGVFIKTYYSYEGNNLLMDSSYGDYLKPQRKSPPSTNIKTYEYGENVIYCSNLRLEKARSIDKDTSYILNGNIVKNVYLHYDGKGRSTGVRSLASYVYDNRVNPLRISLPRQTRQSTKYVNNNNIIAYHYRGDDSISVTSKFVYDEDGYPLTENYSVKHYFPEKPRARYIRRYFYILP